MPKQVPEQSNDFGITPTVMNEYAQERSDLQRSEGGQDGDNVLSGAQEQMDKTYLTFNINE